jgi:hypothetical protein
VRRSWIFYTAMMAIALGIGVLQMFRVPAGLLTDYGADVFGTAWLYAMFRQGRTVFGRGRAMTAPLTAVFVFTGCAVSEFAQAAEILPGVFDSFDLLAFAVSVAACYALDRHVDLGP